MSQIRSDLWCAAFVRRHNDLGEMCVIARRGDPVAGQIWLLVDHLDGTESLYGPAPVSMDRERDANRVFECRLERVAPPKVQERVVREADFDPDFWLVSLETRRTEDLGIEMADNT